MQINKRDTTTHLLEWPKSGTLTARNADTEQEALSFIAGGNAQTLEDNLTVS